MSTHAATAGRRIGLGHDIHRLEPGGRLVLGGVEIEAERGFVTPSDGDVLCHALIDALAGALGHGDMGAFFPADDDPAAQGARSLDYVASMADHVRRSGYAVEHVDTYITLGTTRLSPHLDGMRRNLAQALGVDHAAVSVKARTNDGIGPEGEGRAASAHVGLLLRSLDEAARPGERAEAGTDAWLRGRCACQAVAYEVADEFAAAFNCHCSNCRAMTGSAFLPWGEIERGKLRVVEGALLTVGEAEVRCEACLSLLYWTVPGRDQVRVPYGTLVDAPSLRPTAHIFVGSKAAWHEILDDLPQHDEHPPR